MIIGNEECPETKRKHLQCAIYFNSERSFNSVQKMLAPRHISIANGTPEQNRTYCSKDGDFEEFGDCPEQGRRNDLENIKKKIDGGASRMEIRNTISYGHWLQYGRRLTEDILDIETKRNWKTKVIVLCGDLDNCEEFAVKCGATRVYKEDKYIMGYNGEDSVYFHRFNYKEWSEDLFLDLIGNKPFSIRVLYGTRNWKPKVIYFITNWEPIVWFPTRKWIKQIETIRM